MGITIEKIGARTMPLGFPQSQRDEEEDGEQDRERDEDRRQRYLHSSLDEEASDVGYWMSLHHHHDDGNSDDPMEVEEESEEDHGPPDIDRATANANQRMDYERIVGGEW